MICLSRSPLLKFRVLQNCNQNLRLAIVLPSSWNNRVLHIDTDDTDADVDGSHRTVWEYVHIRGREGGHGKVDVGREVT